MVKKIDFLLITRGVLAISVIIWHVEGYKENFWTLFNLPGRTAVILFFGMSGYVISHGFIFEKYTFCKADLRMFYKRRVYRIMPLFLLISITTLFYQYFLKGEWLLSTEQILPELFMFQFNHNYPLNGVFWTLGIEMQFYIIAPFIIYFTMYYLKSLSKQLIFYFLLFGFYLLLAYFNGIDSRNLFGNLIHFFSGILFCKYTKDYGVPKISNGLLGLLILVLITISNYFYHTFGYAYFTLGLLMINSCIPLLIILHHNLNEILFQDKNLLGSSFLNFGTISYGIYAWHPLVMKLMEKYNNLNLIPIVILTITIAYVSYNFFEKPILSYVTKKK